MIRGCPLPSAPASRFMRRCWARAANVPRRSPTCRASSSNSPALPCPSGFARTSTCWTWRVNPRPPLDLSGAQWLGAKPPSLAALRGHPILLFFWAHWCSDCKAEVAIVANLQRTFAPQGLVVIGPTRFYGYVAGGEDAPPAKEKPYIEEIRRRYYAALPGNDGTAERGKFHRLRREHHSNAGADRSRGCGAILSPRCGAGG